MAIKDNFEYIKKEIGTQEQFLENAIRGERFLKKNKTLFIAIFAILIIVLIVYATKEYMNSSNLDSANKAYNSLLSNSKDSNAINILKQKDPSLFALYVIKNYADTNDTNTAILDKALSLQIDPLLKNIIENIKGKDQGQILSDYDALLNGYELLKKNQINEARLEFSKIPSNSQLEPISKNLEHYQGK